VAGTGGRGAGGGQGAAAPAAAVSSSSPPRAIMALMSTGPATAAAVESTPKIELLESTPTAEKAIKGHLHTKIQGSQAQKFNTDVNTMLLN
jgi:hypothetical protein